MKLDFELTNQTKILLGILSVALIAAIATQWGPGFYKIVSNSDMETKRETLKTSKDLVDASKILQPIETGLYQKTGLADEGKTTTIFEGSYHASVVRRKIDAIVKKAGIPQNYQINMEPVPGRQSERISPQARRNLVVFAYQQKLEAEKDALNAEIAAFEAELQAQSDQAQPDGDMEVNTMDMFLDAWLDEADVESEEQEDKESEEQEDKESEEQEDKESEEQEDKEKTEDKDESTEKTDDPNQEKPEKLSDDENDKEETPDTYEESDKNQTDAETSADKIDWEFAALPDAMPISIRFELIDLIIPMIEQHLVGAEKTLFENHYFKTQTRATSGFFGIGAKEPTNEISFRPNSEVLAKLTNLIDTHGEALNKQQLRRDFLEYMDKIQSQIDELSRKLQLAPTVYVPESYTVKMKFKAEIDKLVNLNKIIETTSKWLMVRDLQISTDNKENKINVDVLMIARVYQ